MLVGEAWGAEEARVKKPFQGLAGKVLDGILEEVGIPREECYITNVLHEKPLNNNFGTYYIKEKGKKVPSPKLLRGYERLRREIESVKPNVIVPMGNEAMKAVLGFDGVMNWRGSVLNPLGKGKVIPTIHPAAVLREWTYRVAVVNDFERIRKEGESDGRHRVDRILKINPTFQEAIQAIQEAQEAEWCAFDIEVETGEITCIGLSYELNKAICIPLARGFNRKMWRGENEFWTEEESRELHGALRGLLESESPKKIAHNGMFDVEWIESCLGIKVLLQFDTMLAFHCLCPELPKALAYLVSIYTDHPYYKYQIKTDDPDVYWRYNATDACVTFECAMDLNRELSEQRLDSFYYSHIHSLVIPLLNMQNKGVRFNTVKCKELKSKYHSDIIKLQNKLNKAVGHELNIGSPKQMTEWLYDELKLPKKYRTRKATGNKTLAADEEALNEIYIKHPLESIRTVLSIREKKKTLSTYLSVKLDGDKRIRCSYNITGTETGRLSSSATSRRTGTNLQNIPDGVIRDLFIPDEGKVFVNADLSQAEARVVACLADEIRLIELFESGGDIHRKNASTIFKVKEKEVTNGQRDLAKRVIHASNYGMGYRTFSRTAGIPQVEAKRLLAQYFATYPRIKLWHMEIQSVLKRTRTITTPLGRRRVFFNRWGDSLVKEALAFVPQSTVADIVSQGLICLDKLGTEILLQVHDSVLVQCLNTPRCIKTTVNSIRRCMEIPVEINKKKLVIPVDFKVGYSWGKMRKYGS